MSNVAAEWRLSFESKPTESTLTWDIFRHQERRLAESSSKLCFDELQEDAPDPGGRE